MNLRQLQESKSAKASLCRYCKNQNLSAINYKAALQKERSQVQDEEIQASNKSLWNVFTLCFFSSIRPKPLPRINSSSLYFLLASKISYITLENVTACFKNINSLTNSV